jgi:D-3-phosphoglycerate dehydrogenase
MKLAAYDPNVTFAKLEAEGAVSCSLEFLLSISDFISIHAPLSQDTHHLIDRRALALVKPTAILINCSRGRLIDEVALTAALSEGHLAGAGLDVLETEPPAADNPRLKLEQVILTPHTAAHTAAALERVRRVAVENLLRVLRGEHLLNIVNPSVGQR